MSQNSSSRRSSVFRYSRSEMMLLRESRTRPLMLSKEFDNEEGLFSPDKWLQQHWMSEGVESKECRVVNKKKVKPEVENLEQAVLSPQRRAFSSGCRAPSPKITDEDKQGKARWRHGANNGLDFKPAFQKNALDSRTRTSSSSNNGSTVWRNNTSDGGKAWADRSSRPRQNYEERSERVPEWLDEGPSSMTDIIELKGFEEDDVKERGSKKRGKAREVPNTMAGTEDILGRFDCDQRHEQKQLKSRSNSASNGSRPMSRCSGNSRIDRSAIHKCDGDGDLTVLSDKQTSASSDFSAALFPNSDAEFAAYLGILDIGEIGAANPLQPESAGSSQPSSSRLSRFFSNNKKGQMESEAPQQVRNLFSKDTVRSVADSAVKSIHRAIVGRQEDVESSNLSNSSLPPMLQTLFDNAAPKHAPGELNGMLTVEELERNALLTGRSIQNQANHLPPQHSMIAQQRQDLNSFTRPNFQPNPAAMNAAFLQAQFLQNASQAQIHANARQHPTYINNGMMTVEEIERHAMMGRQIAQHQQQTSQLGSSPLQNTMNPVLLQAQMHQNMQQQQQAQIHQQQQQQQQNLLLQQAPLPVLQKLFSGANSPSTSKYKYPPPPQQQQQHSFMPLGPPFPGPHHIPDPVMERGVMKFLAHQAEMNNEYIPAGGPFPPNFRPPPPAFDMTSFASDQQQLSLAITRGDLVSAQAIRSRIMAHAQALAAAGIMMPPFQDSNQ